MPISKIIELCQYLKLLNYRLIGSSGNDILVGGKGKDILTGGNGVDRFFFESPKDGIDKITDFNALNEL